MTFAASLLDLLEHPTVLAGVLEEQQQVLRPDRPLDLSVLVELPSLMRVINESLRRFGNGGLWRLTRKPVEISGRTIPENSLVGTSMGLVNEDAEFYEAPEDYNPERYRTLRTDDFQSPSVKDRRFGAFGLGRHLCPGRGLAYVMVGTAIATLLRDYRISWFVARNAGLD
jgi:sterol 14alpha-demethylase